MRWSRVRWRRRRRCLGTKRVPRRNGFTFRCYDITNVNKRERGKERGRQSKKHQTYIISNDKNSKVCIHEHVTF